MQIINAHRRYDSWCLPRDPWNADALLSFAEDLLYTPSPTHLVATLLKTAADRDTINLCTRVLQVNCTLSRPLDYSRSTQYISCHPYPSIVHYCLSRWGGGALGRWTGILKLSNTSRTKVVVVKFMRLALWWWTSTTTFWWIPLLTPSRGLRLNHYYWLFKTGEESCAYKMALVPSSFQDAIAKKHDIWAWYCIYIYYLTSHIYYIYTYIYIYIYYLLSYVYYIYT